MTTTYSMAYATDLCNSVPGMSCELSTNKCLNYRTGCAAWNRIDPFKRLFIDIEHKRRQNEQKRISHI